MAWPQFILTLTGKLKEDYVRLNTYFATIKGLWDGHVSGISDKHAGAAVTLDPTDKTKITAGEVQTAIDQIENEIKQFVDVSANAEVGDAHVSTVKSKTFADVRGRFEEIEQDHVTQVNEFQSHLSDNTTKFAEVDSDISTLQINKADKTEVNALATNKVDLATYIAGIGELASGTPLTASSTTGMTDTTRLYVNTTDGYLYSYNGTIFTSTGLSYPNAAISTKGVSGMNLSADLQQLMDISANITWEQGNLDSSGLPSASSSYIRTSDLMTFEEGQSIYLTDTNYSFKVCLYTSSGTYLSSVSWYTKYVFSAKSYAKFVLRLNGSTAILPTVGQYVKSINGYKISSTIDLLQDWLTDTSGVLGSRKPTNFVLGGISNSTGINNTTNVQIRSYDYISIKAGQRVFIRNYYPCSIKIFYYSAPSTANYLYYKPYCKEYTFAEDAIVRFVIKADDSSDLTSIVDAISSNFVLTPIVGKTLDDTFAISSIRKNQDTSYIAPFSYTGEKVNLAKYTPSTYNYDTSTYLALDELGIYTDESSIPHGGQGFTVFGDVGFVFYDQGYCRTLDLINKTEIAKFILPDCPNVLNHAGQANFGIEYISGNTDFPALYLSSYLEEKCYVYSITTTGATLVQTISIAGGQAWFIDREFDKMIVKLGGTRADGVTKYKYYKVYDIPALSDGDITLTDDYACDEFYIRTVRGNAAVYPAAGFAMQGKLYFIAGGERIFVYDYLNHTILTEIHYTAVILTAHEAEQCALYDGGLLINFNGGDYLAKLTF